MRLMTRAGMALLVIAPIYFAGGAEAQTGRSTARSARARTVSVAAGARPNVRSINQRIRRPKLTSRQQQVLRQQASLVMDQVDGQATAPVHILPATRRGSRVTSRTVFDADLGGPAQIITVSGLGPEGYFEGVGTFAVSGHVQNPQWGGLSRATVDGWARTDRIQLSLEPAGSDRSGRIRVLSNEPSRGHSTQIPFRAQLKPGENSLFYSRNAQNGGTSEGSESYLRHVVIRWDGT